MEWPQKAAPQCTKLYLSRSQLLETKIFHFITPSRFSNTHVSLASKAPSAGLPNLWNAYPKMAHGKISLARGIHCCPSLFNTSFPRPESLNCAEHVYIHTHTHTHLTAYRLYMNCRCYQTTLQWNIWIPVRAVRSVDRIFIVGPPVWRWLDQSVTLDRTFYSLLLKQQAAAATVTATGCSCRIPQGGLHYKYSNYTAH